MKQLVIMVTAAAAFLAAMAAEAASLRPDTIVVGDHVTVGDLFVGIETGAEAMVARAPAPGRRQVFDTAFLVRVSNAYRLGWRPASQFDQVVVTRASTVVTTDAIHDALVDALTERADGSRLAVELDNSTLEVHLPVDSTPSVAVETLSYDPGQARFTAVLAAPAASPNAQRFQVTGRAQRLMEIPVLNRRLRTGDIIGAADIDWIEVRADRVGSDVLVDERRLIGTTPRRMIAAETMIRVRDIMAPVLVSKGSLVTVMLKTPTILLTAQGRALGNGAEGEVIRVVNTQSNRTIEAIVTGPNMVTVTSPGGVALN